MCHLAHFECEYFKYLYNERTDEVMGFLKEYSDLCVLSQGAGSWGPGPARSVSPLALGPACAGSDSGVVSMMEFPGLRWADMNLS